MATGRPSRMPRGSWRPFADLHLYVRVNGAQRPVVVRRRTQLAVATALFVLSGAVGFSGVAALTGRLAAEAQRDRSAELEAALLATDERYQAIEAELRGQLDEFRSKTADQRDTIAHLLRLQESLRAELAVTDRQLGAVSAERDAARRLVLAIHGGAHDDELWRQDSAREREALAARLAVTELRLATAEQERDAARAAEKSLRGRVEVLESRLEQVRTSFESATTGLKGAIGDQVERVRKLLTHAGADPDLLIRRANRQLPLPKRQFPPGQGGPFEPAPARSKDAVSLAATLPFFDDLERLRTLQRVLTVVPLVPPLAEYTLSSGFGVRADPITRKAATHTGLDFNGPYNASVLAAAPGRVTTAGRVGDYGILVEVDHGLGLATRYAHLSRTLVRAGDVVTTRQPIGIMGSTGRSTGRHLHYEIRLDGEALDPAAFLEVGRQLAHVLKGQTVDSGDRDGARTGR